MHLSLEMPDKEISILEASNKCACTMDELEHYYPDFVEDIPMGLSIPLALHHILVTWISILDKIY